jgi:hypothetical protein
MGDDTSLSSPRAPRLRVKKSPRRTREDAILCEPTDVCVFRQLVFQALAADRFATHGFDGGESIAEAHYE